MVLIIQGLVLVVIIGVSFTLWKSTAAYGGLIGQALKLIGIGIVFFALEALDRVLGPLSFVDALNLTSDPAIVHNIILILGLAFSAFGFSKLTKISQ